MSYLLAVDIGNTNTVIGVMQDGRVLKSWRVTTGNLQTEDELGMLLLSFLERGGYSLNAIKSVGICSVVPDVTAIYQKISTRYFGKEPFSIGPHLDMGIHIRYKDPMAVGADRLANVLAAFLAYGGPGIVIDFGTATTFDVYSADCDYLGGVIAPGIETSAMALHRRAAKLPRIELTLPETVIAKTTTESMQNGILLGTLAATEGIIKKIENELGEKAVLTLTGGFGQFIQDHSSLHFNLRPDLVLEGIWAAGLKSRLF
ncbi:MAG: type III pantothenate kinase [Bacteroidetes bacterium]|nr:type III pantothenate kinase [Bacteroidota bacterium]